jgi:hypothetical protein
VARLTGVLRAKPHSPGLERLVRLKAARRASGRSIVDASIFVIAPMSSCARGNARGMTSGRFRIGTYGLKIAATELR